MDKITASKTRATDGDEKEVKETREERKAREEAERIAALPPLGQSDLERYAAEETIKLRERKAKEIADEEKERK